MSKVRLDVDELERNAFKMRRQFRAIRSECSPGRPLLENSSLRSGIVGSESP